MIENELKSGGPLDGWRQDPPARTEDDDPATRKWQIAKRIVLALLLAAAFLIYYLTAQLYEALSRVP